MIIVADLVLIRNLMAIEDGNAEAEEVGEGAHKNWAGTAVCDSLRFEIKKIWDKWTAWKEVL